MTDLSNFLVTKKWPPTRPDVLQLYSFPTPNGRKIGIALEELGLDYEPHLVVLSDDILHSPEFLSVSPNNKIPAIIDPNGPDGETIALFESGAILLYLAEKTGKLLPADVKGKAEVIQWLMWQMGGLGPMGGQLGYYVKFAGKDIEDPRPRERYLDEVWRLLNVLNTRLEGRDWVADEFSIADIAIVPWIIVLDIYGAAELLDLDDFTNVIAYRERFLARPAVQRGLNVPPRPIS